jgi:N-acetylglucosamine kinase-like BadF-type ATPase
MWNLILDCHCILLRWTYADPSWARIAALVPVVVSSAEDGDEVANKILHDSVQELADTVIAVVRRLRLCGEGNAYVDHGTSLGFNVVHQLYFDYYNGVLAS